MARTKIALVGVPCFPTSTKFHATDRTKGTAYAPGRAAYILKGADPEAYPPLVALECDDPAQTGWGEDDDLTTEIVKTMHPVAGKNLPDRFVVGFISADDQAFGEVPAKGESLPQWECLMAPDGGTDMALVDDAKARIVRTRAAVEAAKQAKRTAKKA